MLDSCALHVQISSREYSTNIKFKMMVLPCMWKSMLSTIPSPGTRNSLFTTACTYMHATNVDIWNAVVFPFVPALLQLSLTSVLNVDRFDWECPSQIMSSVMQLCQQNRIGRHGWKIHYRMKISGKSWIGQCFFLMLFMINSKPWNGVTWMSWRLNHMQTEGLLGILFRLRT